MPNGPAIHATIEILNGCAAIFRSTNNQRPCSRSNNADHLVCMNLHDVRQWNVYASGRATVRTADFPQLNGGGPVVRLAESANVAQLQNAFSTTWTAWTTSQDVRKGDSRNQLCYLRHHATPYFLVSIPPAHAGKGVLGFQSPTGGWVGRSAAGREKKKMEPSANDLKMVLEGHPL